jgi:hypothetical protein
MCLDDLKIWLNHFEYHAEHPRQVPPGTPDLLTSAERSLIASSIATFQLGERSEGSTLVRAAQRFAGAHEVPCLVRIVELFIREEQRHAALLRDFMVDHQISLRTEDWTDWTFRRLRRLAGLELYLYVLISAELIGNVYYRALETVTACQRLRMLCRALVCDELAHVGFESQMLLALRARRSAPMRTALRLAHRIFFTGAAAVVWSTHSAVLRQAGCSARSFLRMCLAQYAFYLEPVDAALASTSLP